MQELSVIDSTSGCTQWFSALRARARARERERERERKKNRTI